MIFDPSILALTVSSLLVSIMVLYSAFHGIRILRHWDLKSGSELQLSLERQTYLISTIVSYFLAFQLVSLFLFIHTADGISSLFVGAMCAVGTLTVNGFGFPTLLLKIVTFVLAGLWLIVNHADSRAYDYPLIRPKYWLLLVMAPFILAENVVQGIYFLGLKPDIITSCCGSLFSPASRGIATELANAPAVPMLVVFYATVALTCAFGLRFIVTGRGGYPFAALSGASGVVALAAVVSAVSLYIYEIPSHHCPFCILQHEYVFIGYPLYVSLLTASVTGMGVGILAPFRKRESLVRTLPPLQRRLAVTAVSSFLALSAIVTFPIIFSGFQLTTRVIGQRICIA